MKTVHDSDTFPYIWIEFQKTHRGKSVICLVLKLSTDNASFIRELEKPGNKKEK